MPQAISSQRPCLAIRLPILDGAPRRGVELDAVAAVALDQPLDPHEEIGPHRLDAEVAAPDAAEQRVRQEQRERGEDQQAGEVIDFLRPDLDEEPIEPRVGQIDQHRLVRLVRPAVPSHEGENVVEPEADDQQRPLQAAVGSADLLRVDFGRRSVKRALVVDFGPSFAFVLFRCAHSPAPRLWTNTASVLIVTGSRRAPQAGMVELRANVTVWVRSLMSDP